MLPLRSIHDRLQLETVRAAFWELLAKRALAGNRSETTPSTPPEPKQTVMASTETLEEMVMQMNELGASLEALKEQSSRDRDTIAGLRQEILRTDRLKNGYKRQVGELNAVLEAKARVGSGAARSRDEDVVGLQRRVAEMRVQMEGLKRERDEYRAQSEVAEGRFEELRGRFARREQALVSAQRRCRELSEALVAREDRGVGTDGAGGDIAGGADSLQTLESMETSEAEEEVMMGTGEQEGTDEAKEANEANVADEAEQKEDIEEVEDSPVERTGRGDGNCEEADVRQEAASAVTSTDTDTETDTTSEQFISTASPLYVQIFGQSSDLSSAAEVLISADDALVRCAARIQRLGHELDAARDESHQLKSQCAEQYNLVFKYKTMCTTLAAKVRTLEAHAATVEHSAGEYQRQMEQLIQRQRAAAAEESHKLSNEIQFMSEEQARLLLKLHAVQLDLDKSRAMAGEMERRCLALEGQLRSARFAEGLPGSDRDRTGGSIETSSPLIQAHPRAGVGVGEESARLKKLEIIAAGLRRLGEKTERRTDVH